jgi:glutamate racemase
MKKCFRSIFRDVRVLKNSLKVGVFDSGIGGLTVLRNALMEFPFGIDFFYFADTARVPYGSKPVATIRRYVHEIFEFFYSIGIDVIVTACNTSDSILTQKEKESLPVPYFSIIDPAVRSIGEIAPANSSVSIIATSNTVKRSLYLRRLFRYDTLSEITQKACPLFVPIIEEGIWEGDMVEAVVHYYLADLGNQRPDFLVLGCTHYPFIRGAIEKSLPPTTRIIDPADFIVLDMKRQLHPSSKEDSTVEYFVSGDTGFFQDVLKRYFGMPGVVKQVDLSRDNIVVRG